MKCKPKYLDHTWPTRKKREATCRGEGGGEKCIQCGIKVVEDNDMVCEERELGKIFEANQCGPPKFNVIIIGLLDKVM